MDSIIARVDAWLIALAFAVAMLACWGYLQSFSQHEARGEAMLEKIKRGELGVKTGKGFYTYPNPEFLQPDFLNPQKKIDQESSLF